MTTYVGLASANHGTAAFTAQCGLPTGCAAAHWQQRLRSAFLTALTDGPRTWPGISYTEIATRFDEVVVPYTSTFLPPPPNATNVTAQDLCPTEVVEHFGMSYDNAAWLIGLDALAHAGPARLGRIDHSSCGRPLMPGVQPAHFPSNAALGVGHTAVAFVTAPMLRREPALRRYARRSR